MKKVYVVHGWTYSLDKWQPIIPLLADKGIELVLLKVPGLTTPSDKVWDITGYMDWFNDQIKGVKAPVVLGHSNGGRIVLNYLTKHPDRLGSLILLDAAGVVHDEARSKTKLGILRAVSMVGKPLSKIPIVKKVFYRLIGANDYYQAPENMKKTMQNMLAANKMIDYSKITLPTTLIWGEHDQQTPLSDAHYMRDHIVGSTLHVVAEGRHAPMFTHPEEVAQLIVEAVL